MISIHPKQIYWKHLWKNYKQRKIKLKKENVVF